jgi:hypothetical protein
MAIFDISGDWAFIDGIETVEIEANDDENVITVEGCSSNEIINSQVSYVGNLGGEPSTMQWSIPVSNMQGMKLKNGYKIKQTNGDEWIVNSFSESTMGTRYRANTTKATK